MIFFLWDVHFKFEITKLILFLGRFKTEKKHTGEVKRNHVSKWWTFKQTNHTSLKHAFMDKTNSPTKTAERVSEWLRQISGNTKDPPCAGADPRSNRHIIVVSKSNCMVDIGNILDSQDIKFTIVHQKRGHPGRTQTSEDLC